MREGKEGIFENLKLRIFFFFKVEAGKLPSHGEPIYCFHI